MANCEIEARAFTQMILDRRPEILLTDKGIGFVNALEIIDVCKEAGI